jgi:hypothetical protein
MVELDLGCDLSRGSGVKMGFLDRFRRGDSDEPVRLLQQSPDESDFFDSFDPSELPYASEFELPREEARLRAVYEHERRGGNFVIRKPYSNKGRTSRELLTLDRFPLYDEVVQAVEELYGGGTYNVSPVNSQKVLKSYAIDGPAKSGGPKEGNAGGRGASGTMTVKQRLENQAERELDGLLQNDPELGRTLAGAILKKQFGVDLPGVSSYEEKLFQSELENNPEYRQQYLEATLKNKGVKPRKEAVEGDEFDRLIIALEKAQKLKDAMGNGADGADGTSWRGVMQDAIKAGAEFFKGGGTLPIPLGGGTPAIAQQQALAPAAEERVQAPPRPPEPIPSPRPPTPQRQRVMGMSQSDLTPEQPPQQEKLPAVDLADIDWMALLPQVDWSELEGQVNGDPGDFMQSVYTHYYEHDSEPHGILRDLFLHNTPQAIVGAFVDAGQMLSKPWVMGLARAVGKTADIKCAGRIVERLTATAEGQHWIAEAAAAARIIEQRLIEVEAGSEVPQPLPEESGEGTFPEADESEESDANMLMHPGLHSVLEGGEEDEDNFDVVR